MGSFFAPVIGSFVDKQKQKYHWILIPLFLGSAAFLMLGSVESFISLLIIIMFFQVITTIL
ncbi:hypothetical protein J18TS1_18070 [Oceanobacillus oncorhynchi subsp. incaldanensis]|nr:hypothetical protein J18TS1_18070 [Oceanobacillus oncorhynchi subsp. incaldanensis]